MSTFILYNKQGSGQRTGSETSSLSEKYGLKAVDSTIFKRLMYNELHKKFKTEISSTDAKRDFGLELDDGISKVEIIAMPELNENQVSIYLDTFNDEPDNIEEYAEYLSIISYQQVSPENFNVKKKLSKLLESQSNYWDDSSNCKYSLNDKFKTRRFNNIDFTSNIDLINNTLIGPKTNSEIQGSNYLQDIIRQTDWVDSNIKSGYFISKPSDISNDKIIQIYKSIPSEYLKYTFICNLLVTRTHCHLVLNNQELLVLAKPIFTKYKIIFKYLIGYAWLTFRNEESLIKTKIKDDDRIIFDIDTASQLPLYPLSYDDINQNPYACVLLDRELINMKKNCVALNMMKDYEKYYGVTDSKEFYRRLKLFINNGENTDGILKLIDWNHFAVTGSAMTACGMKYNPLMDICKQNQSEPVSDGDYNFFFTNYYNGSDIDLVCNHKSIYDFMNSVNDFTESMKQINTGVKIESVHTGTIIVSEEFIGHELENLKNIIKNPNADITTIKASIHDQEVKNYLYDKYYIPWKISHAEQLQTNQKKDTWVYQEYLKPIPKEEFRIYTLDYEIDECDYEKQDYEKYMYWKDINPDSTDKVNKLVMKMSESIRYKINSNQTRTFEIFKTRDSSFFSIISKFHMGFVRAYWNGSTVKCLPSYITSMMLQLSTDYKYFASIRDPIEIVNKYRSRGFGIILNDHEKVHMVCYNGFRPKNGKENKWVDIYNLNMKNKNSIESVFGPRNSNDDLFKPGKHFMGLPTDVFKNVNHNTVSDFGLAFEPIFGPGNKFPELAKLKAINDKGFINPLERHMITHAYLRINSEI